MKFTFLTIGIIFIIIALFILIHQVLVYDVWFEWEDLHHETWMIMFTFAGLILIGIKGIK